MRSIRIPDVEMPILLGAFVTVANATSVEALETIAIKMYESHRGELGAPEVFPTDLNRDNEGCSSKIGESEFIDGSGQVFSLKHQMPRNNAINQAMVSHQGDGMLPISKEPEMMQNADGIYSRWAPW